ncbi:hypothetical protein GCM10010123_33610 [Pilimelia anulata]|uniref:Uncharacterized protein n=1 Tax=Pilimelia anulata TaxID=53371 RepID=A0A8J3BB35_9ACTN|nr:hypothetical protein [Pilimelia anulata]GGK00929.1 hypothetical protein GCM10010123_33610 [Pilimelia anulata]
MSPHPRPPGTLTPEHLLALAALVDQRPATHTSWRYIAESMAHELRRLAAAATRPPEVRWWSGQVHPHIRHARLPHGVPGVTVDLHSRLVLDGVAALLPRDAALRGWALISGAALCDE